MILSQKLYNAMHCKLVGERKDCVFVQNRKSCTQANISIGEADLIFSSWLLASFIKYASNPITHHLKCLATLVCRVKSNIFVRAFKAHNSVLNWLFSPDTMAILFCLKLITCCILNTPSIVVPLDIFLLFFLPCHRDPLYSTKPTPCLLLIETLHIPSN